MTWIATPHQSLSVRKLQEEALLKVKAQLKLEQEAFEFLGKEFAKDKGCLIHHIPMLRIVLKKFQMA